MQTTEMPQLELHGLILCVVKLCLEDMQIVSCWKNNRLIQGKDKSYLPGGGGSSCSRCGDGAQYQVIWAAFQSLGMAYEEYAE